MTQDCCGNGPPTGMRQPLGQHLPSIGLDATAPTLSGASL